MRLYTKNSFLLIIIFIITASCSEHSISGQWKVQQIKLSDTMHNKSFIIDLSHPGKVKRDMLDSFLQEPKEEGDEIDTSEMKADIDKTVASYLKSSLILTNDKRFSMASYGLIVMTAVPGWHFGDSLAGTWTTNKDVLTLSTGDSSRRYYWEFKILQLTSKKLKLREMSQGVSGTKETSFGFQNDIEFIRQ